MTQLESLAHRRGEPLFSPEAFPEGRSARARANADGAHCKHALVEALSEQRLLFASLASSAFLIYLDPQHARTPCAAMSSALAALDLRSLRARDHLLSRFPPSRLAPSSKWLTGD